MLAPVLIDFTCGVAQLDRGMANVNCRNIRDILYDKNGNLYTYSCISTGTTNANRIIEIPKISILPFSLMYVSEITLEIESCPDEDLKTNYEELTKEGDEVLDEVSDLRALTASLGFNTDVQLETTENGTTSLKYTIYKDGITMTRFMEKWLANVQQDIIIESLEEIIVENK
jgi:hypothetical protein